MPAKNRHLILLRSAKLRFSVWSTEREYRSLPFPLFTTPSGKRTPSATMVRKAKDLLSRWLGYRRRAQPVRLPILPLAPRRANMQRATLACTFAVTGNF